VNSFRDGNEWASDSSMQNDAQIKYIQ
jgi:hypothetical protein